MANITSTDKLITLTGLNAFKAKMLQKITESQYDDTEVRGLISTNKTSISTLTGKVNKLNATEVCNTWTNLKNQFLFTFILIDILKQFRTWSDETHRTINDVE